MKGNFIIHDKAKQYQWSGDCFLSIKSFHSGKANYQVGFKHYQVYPEKFLVLNECSKYNLTIDNQIETESFCVFFSPEFVSKIVSSNFSNHEQLLDFPQLESGGMQFVERLYNHNSHITNQLLYGKNYLLQSESTLQKEQFFHQLLNALVLHNKEALRESDKLVLKKKSTRIEIYERLHLAKEFIDSNFADDLSLQQISIVALLSENHFLRCFSQVFGTSPFKYISHLRISEACKQLKETDKPINEIAMSVGYSSISNFSFYFKTIVGVSPSKYKMVIYSKPKTVYSISFDKKKK
ncbi:helix-turn-helix domain-containing protein [Chondrinema litorale]|uniref:helix-turn-helix domain-containing protein n=1 Tax=Chondrinema litorale TaxID=2994555 RepID=UPI0025437EC8|nr:AraC family transcriptional regulator [Chondrinema litorale]UZR98153.1 AraC family transcriptional regulator [Chondrinema litorale]